MKQFYGIDGSDFAPYPDLAPSTRDGGDYRRQLSGLHDELETRMRAFPIKAASEADVSIFVSHAKPIVGNHGHGEFDYVIISKQLDSNNIAVVEVKKWDFKGGKTQLAGEIDALASSNGDTSTSYGILTNLQTWYFLESVS
ncbi:hypothetical protein BGZ47_003902 [Haplosporangium gracile]|nr:hypothetical protein BGZ47_003902 [Haplosporangium gracile]